MRSALLALLVATLACGSDNTVTPPPLQPLLKIAAGDGQSGPSWSTLPVPLEIALTTSAGAALVNVPVQWSVTAGGGTLQDASALTDNAGHATAKLSVGATGAQTVDAFVAKYTLHTTFSETAVYPTRVVVVHYDGTSWTTSLQESHGAYPTAYAIWGPSASEIFVAGETCNGELFDRYTAGAWQDIPSLCSGPPIFSQYYASISGTSANDLYAIFVSRASPDQAVAHFDGQNWTAPYVIKRPLYAVSEKAPNNVIAVGAGGWVARYDGTSWNGLSIATQSLRAVWANPASVDVFAVGDFGTIVHFDGTAWQQQTSGTTQNLLGLWGTSATDVFAVGAGGTILHYDGTSWSSQASGTNKQLNGVWASSSNSAFAVGDGVILRYDGTSWTSQSVGIPMTLHAVWGTSPTNVYAAGTGPTQ